ncbi:MAG: hypothetical protein ACFFDD_15685, partial [Promethearchaeota archaeon]
MNEFESYPSTSRFDPPEEGVLPGESIVWTRRAGTSFVVIFFGFIVVIGGPVLVVVGTEEFGPAFTLPFLFLALAGILAVLASLVQTKRTRYYLTSERILETRGGNVLKEVSLHHFAGKPIGQFLESRVTHMSNNRP